MSEAKLRPFGFLALNDDQWQAGCVHPQLTITVGGHAERDSHTFYVLLCQLDRGNGVSSHSWQVQHRLAHLRDQLHDRVKKDLGKSYAQHFGDAPFAKKGGFSGTTERLQKWLQALGSCITQGDAPPALVAHVMEFMEAPPPDFGPQASSPASAAAEPAAGDSAPGAAASTALEASVDEASAERGDGSEVDTGESHAQQPPLAEAVEACKPEVSPEAEERQPTAAAALVAEEAAASPARQRPVFSPPARSTFQAQGDGTPRSSSGSSIDTPEPAEVAARVSSNPATSPSRKEAVDADADDEARDDCSAPSQQSSHPASPAAARAVGFGASQDGPSLASAPEVMATEKGGGSPLGDDPEAEGKSDKGKEDASTSCTTASASRSELQDAVETGLPDLASEARRLQEMLPMEAAEELAFMSPKEAATLVSLMKEESRAPVMACMQCEVRDAVAAAMPADMREAAGYMGVEQAGHSRRGAMLAEEEMLEADGTMISDATSERSTASSRPSWASSSLRGSTKAARLAGAAREKLHRAAATGGHASRKAASAATGVAGAARQGLEKAAGSKNVTAVSDKAKVAAAGAAELARSSLGTAAEKARKARDATGIAPEEVGGRVSGAAVGAAESARAKLSRMSRGVAGLVGTRRSERPAS